MFTAIAIDGFKCFQGLRLPLLPLNVFCGYNGSGKSSVVQAFLFLRAAAKHRGVVSLNHSPLALGTAGEVVHVLRTDMTLGLKGRGKWSEYSSELTSSDENEQFVNGELKGDWLPEWFLPQNFVYLGADRNGPINIEHRSWNASPETLIDERGRGIFEVLDLFGDAPVRPGRRHPSNGGGGQLRGEVEAWLSEWFGSTQVTTENSPRLGLLALWIKQGGIESEPVRPTNTGFGISYVLSIVIAGLWIKHKGVLIVESPEAHLHPRGQSAIGMFLARLAADGVQVVVETHSDHVVNGMRLAVARREGGLQGDQVNLLFFKKVDSQASVERIQIRSDGTIDRWPEGFFDQMDIDLGRLGEHITPEQE